MPQVGAFKKNPKLRDKDHDLSTKAFGNKEFELEW
jgi:hypothetical protein